ncbi:uncharacterized protein LTHEOB_7364 [Lasiodiplodia theobromae]|uniref:uncharacterized protein n=1 Tax=Lasiodiplodia theobromae TaxID=45133 RepID=UPI0015C392C6|nr:uncharacterized protein LTHEOB_7364 [Lasiodiplodia theobromae]KAF4542634.1 hypothetical protein LTHEOB_7364 [Lasiodiplodia theobromae]
MGQALPKHHWHEADRFLVAAQLHVPEEAREAGHAQRQQQQHHQHGQQQQHGHHHHDHHHSRRRHSDSFGLGLTTLTTRPSALSSPSTTSSATSTASTTASSSASPSPSSSDVDDDEGDDDDDDDDSADSTAPPLFTSLPPAEARAITAAHWAHVVQLARGFERVYAGALEAWVCATPPATERPATSSHRRGASRIVRSSSKSSASSGNWTTMKRGRGHVSDGSGGSSGSCGTFGSSGSSSSGGGVGVEDGEGSAEVLRAVEQEKRGKNEREGVEEKRSSSHITIGAKRFLRVHAHTERRTDMGSWTAADLIDLATRGGPLRCYRWHSDGVGREGKERSKRQLTEDAAKLGWCGRMVLSNFQESTTAPGGTGATDEAEKAQKDEEGTVDEETGLYSITVRVLTTAIRNRALSAAVPQVNTTTSDPNNQTQSASSHTFLTITPACLLLIKLLTILYPSGPPWSTSATNDYDFDAQTAQPTANIPEETTARNRRVWIAMSLGWAWALQAYLAAHPSQQSSAADHNNDGIDDDHTGLNFLDAEEYLLEDDDDLLDEDDEDEWQAQLEDMSEVDIDDEDVLAALARVQLSGGGSAGGGQRRASLVPSDGDDDDELREESEGEG